MQNVNYTGEIAILLLVLVWCMVITMLKILGCLIIVAVCGLVGFAKAGRYKARAEQLASCRSFFLRLASLVKGTGEPTRSLFKHLAEAESLNTLLFLKLAGKRLETESDFPTVWRESIDAVKPTLSLNNEDYQPLYGLCEIMGNADAEGIVANATLSAQLYEQAEGMARKEYEMNGKMFRSLGLLCGVAVAVLII